MLACLVKETLQTELSYLRRVRKLIVDFINPMKKSSHLADAASFLFGKSGPLRSSSSLLKLMRRASLCMHAFVCVCVLPSTQPGTHACPHHGRTDAAAANASLTGVEVIYSVNMSYLCDLAVEIGNASLPIDVLREAGQLVVVAVVGGGGGGPTSLCVCVSA